MSLRLPCQALCPPSGPSSSTPKIQNLGAQPSPFHSHTTCPLEHQSAYLGLSSSSPRLSSTADSVKLQGSTHPSVSSSIECIRVPVWKLKFKGLLMLLFFKDFTYLERKVGRKRGRETSINCLLHVSQRGTWPATQAHALIGNQTSDLQFCRMTPNPLSHTGQGEELLLMFAF